jgi:putative acyl-CoA dehydrogenase
MTEATIPASRATVSPVREVLNQPPPLEPIDLFAADAALTESVAQFDAGWAEQRLGALGALAGSSEAREHGRRAERNEPRLLTHDRFGRRIDEVELDPSWHWLLRQAVEHEVHSLPWTAPQPGAHVVHAASVMLWMNANSGVLVPVQMTYSVVPVLREVAPEIAAEWEPRLTTSDYSSCEFVGLGMTERQGGSDVRANVTQAIPIGDGEYELTGHKWFCSYPPCAAFLVLAQAPGGLSCFLVERGSGVEFQRLKDKLGYARSHPPSSSCAPRRLASSVRRVAGSA